MVNLGAKFLWYGITVRMQFKGMCPYNDAQAARQAEVVAAKIETVEIMKVCIHMPEAAATRKPRRRWIPQSGKKVSLHVAKKIVATRLSR